MNTFNPGDWFGEATKAMSGGLMSKKFGKFIKKTKSESNIRREKRLAKHKALEKKISKKRLDEKATKLSGHNSRNVEMEI